VSRVSSSKFDADIESSSELLPHVWNSLHDHGCKFETEYAWVFVAHI
jgi:hypothetical protein